MRNTPFWWIFIAIMILLDVYCFQVLKVITQTGSPRARLIVYAIYWTLSIVAILVLILLPYLPFQHQAKLTRTTVFAIIAGFFFAKLIAALFFLIDDIRRLTQWAAGKLFFSNTEGEVLQQSDGISRSVFLSWVGVLAGGGLFGTLLYGFGNKYKYQIKPLKLSFAKLPTAFKGLKIVQISDVHSGSFTNKAAVENGIQKILDQKPDLILFTGDLVNNLAEEMNDYKEVFAKLKAPMGVFSILGNHDYGDYVKWPDRNQTHEQQETALGKHLLTPLQIVNLNQLKKVHADMGWRLLLDEHIQLIKNDESITLIGVENWSAKARFPKYGSLKKAYEGASADAFKILLSHDPSHWDAEVLTQYPDIDLMLSGHTHGFQFGVELPGFKWSPVQYVYKQWGGLYEQGQQKLYVNTGFGFIGYPGRVGILPEITVFELA